jgi:very-short-patch-repair endonuclease
MIGAYIVDFLCREPGLIVEVDGATYTEDREIAYGRRREVFLKAEGYQIVRVQNDDASKHINDLLDMILMGLEGRL